MLLLAVAAHAGDDVKPSCVTSCHGPESVQHAESVHAQALACVDCHGGDPAAHGDKAQSHDPARGYRGKPPRASIPELCGNCHADAARMLPFALPTDQLAHYRNSNHGQALFGKGDTSVAVCTDCHGIHAILPAHDPRSATAPANLPDTCERCHADEARMKPYGLPTDSVARFLKGVHGRALRTQRRGVPSCADCHGSHGVTPPGVRGIVQVCGHCHVSTQEHYQRSPHFTSDEMHCQACHEEKTSAYRRSSCTVCHNAHDVHQPGEWFYYGDEVGRCGHCHREQDGSLEVVTAIREGRERLDDAMAQTQRAIRSAKAQGLFLEYEEVYLRESARALISVQPLVHSVDKRAIEMHLRDGLERHQLTRESIAKKSKELRDRRILISGLAAILLLLTALFGVKLRAVRRLS
jgi:hypothetical protein